MVTRSLALALVVLAAALVAPALAPSPAPAQGRTVSLRTTDALGGRYDIRRARGKRIVVAVFTHEDAQDTTTSLFVHLDRALMHDPDVEWLSIADVRSYDNVITRGFAERKLRSSMRDGIADRERRLRQSHPDLPVREIARNWRLLADFDGSVIRAFRVGPELGGEPVTYVVDGQGRRSRAMVGHSAGVARRIVAAVEQARGTIEGDD